MRLKHFLIPTLFLFATCTADAQAKANTSFGLDKGQVPVAELGFGYTLLESNSPPGSCGCSLLNGGYGQFVVHAEHGLALVVDLSSAHGNNIGGSTQNVTLFSYLVGVRYLLHPARTLAPYAQVLAGGTEEFSNFTYVQNVNAFTASGGVGATYRVSRHVGITLFEADYVYSRLPNGVNTHQNDIRVSAGIVFRAGSR
jgi:outer membrane immunogenic protein